MGATSTGGASAGVQSIKRYHQEIRTVLKQGRAQMVSKPSASSLIKYEPHRTFAGHSHVVLVTYEIITSQKDYSILSSKVPRWECLIVESVSRFIIILLMPANNEISCLNYSQRRG